MLHERLQINMGRATLDSATQGSDVCPSNGPHMVEANRLIATSILNQVDIWTVKSVSSCDEEDDRLGLGALD